MVITWTQLLQPSEHHLLSFPSIAHAIKAALVGLFILAIQANALEPSTLEHTDQSCKQFLHDMQRVQKIAAPNCTGQSFKELNDCFQANLLRKGERSQQTDEGETSPEFVELIRSFTLFLEPIRPKDKNYDVIVVLGSLFSNMQTRLASVLTLLQEGNLNSKMIVFLGSDRRMSAEMESKKILVQHKIGGLMGKYPSNEIPLPTTETEAIHYILKCSDLPANTPPDKVLHTLARADQPRATTQDTIRTLVADKDVYDRSKTFLFVSSQPYGLLQEASIRAVLGPDVRFDMLADDSLVTHYGLEPAFAQKQLKDTFARLLYQAKKNLEEGHSKSCPLLRPLAAHSMKETPHDEF
jgi:hypothetical protein